LDKIGRGGTEKLNSRVTRKTIQISHQVAVDIANQPMSAGNRPVDAG